MPTIDRSKFGFRGGVRTSYGSFPAPKDREMSFNLDYTRETKEKKNNRRLKDPHSREERQRSRSGHRGKIYLLRMSIYRYEKTKMIS